MNTQTISLDLSKRPAVTPVLYLSQGDKNGTTLNVDVFDNGLPYSLVSYSARLAIRMPKGEGYYEKVGTISGNRATFAIDETHAATVAGTTDVAYVEVYSGSTLIASTQRFRVVILENATENTDPTRAYTNGVEEFLSTSDAMLRTMMNEAEADVDESIVRLNDAINTIGGVTDRAEAAIEAMGDISELAVPLMTTDTRGGAALGTGLLVDEGSLSLGDIVTDSCDGPIYSVDAEGWSEQASTTGKNLLIIAPTQSNEGIVWSVNELGQSVVNGTATAQSPSLRFMDGSVLAAGTYTLSAPTADDTIVAIYSSNSELARAVGGGSNNRVKTFTLNSETSIYVRYYVEQTHGQYVNTVFDAQLESGSTATTYEPYTGAKPSPSPEYPQTIEVARGRNLFTTESADTGHYRGSNGAVSVSAAMLRSRPFAVRQGESYVLHGISKTESYKFVHGLDSSGTWVSLLDLTSGPVSANNPFTCSFTVPSGVDSVEISCAIADEQVQFELGSTPTPYVPFGHVGLEVQGRNLLDPSKLNITDRNNVTRTINADGSFTLSGTTSGTYFAYIVNSDVRHFNPGIGTWSMSVDNRRNLTLYVRVNNQDGTYTTLNGGSSNNVIFMVSQESQYIDIWLSSPSGVNVSGTYFVWLKRGDAATPYEPYHHETRAIPLPLKSDGERWAGGLPDGTGDALAIDSAGRYDWECPTLFTTQAVTDGVSGMVGVDVMSSTGQIADGATVLYASAPTTEHGYIDLPMDIPEGGIITIPELENTNVRCFINGVAELAIHAANWGKRSLESESRIAALEAAVAELATS